jgi:hypothetical protein
MATFASISSPTGNHNSFVVSWLPLASGDEGSAARFSQYTDKSVQVSGIFGGATLRFEGSNDGTTYFPLTDPQGNALDFTSAKLKAVTEATLWVRPRVVGGDGTTNLAVSVLMKE